MHDKSIAGLKAYRPLIIIVGTIFLAATALQQNGGFFMHGFMGLFLVIFAMFKFLDLKGFANGFSMYDIIAGRWGSYGYMYPFIEFMLGLAYLSGWRPTFTYLLTMVVMGASTIGVWRGIKSGEALKCACLGTVLNVPLSIVSVVENVGMATMAAWMFILG